MKFEDFYTRYVGEVIPEKPSYIRNGQALMNFLSDVWPEEYRRITEGKYQESPIDCFYNDSYISITINHLEKVWNKRDEERIKYTFD